MRHGFVPPWVSIVREARSPCGIQMGGGPRGRGALLAAATTREGIAPQPCAVNGLPCAAAGSWRRSTRYRTRSASAAAGRCGGAPRGRRESPPLDLILRPRLGGRLPLHVRGDVLAALRERNDVNDHVPGATVRKAALLHEIPLRP